MTERYRPGYRRAAPVFVAALIVGSGLAFATGANAAGDVAHGKMLFQQQCGLCHTAAPGDGEGGQGPALAGVVGRKAAGAADFSYTPALQGAKLTWTPAKLDQFLTNPQAMVPGTAMPISVDAAQDRADIIAYLATVKPAR